jgi:hypothetical protein
MAIIVTRTSRHARKNRTPAEDRVINSFVSTTQVIKMPAMTRHCWKCGCEWSLSGQPGRGESCAQCRSDLRVCVNCASYDPRVAQQCRDRRAEPVDDKESGNFCEYFDFARRVFRPRDDTNPREKSARDQLNRLFGD